MTKAGAIAILTTIFLGLSGWTMTEVTSLKERVSKNEESKENIKELVKEIRDEQRMINAKIDRLLEERRR